MIPLLVQERSPKCHRISSSFQPNITFRILPLLHQPQFHQLLQTHHQSMHENQHTTHSSLSHQCSPSSHWPEIAHTHQLPTVFAYSPSQEATMEVTCMLPTRSAKFCDECGAPYLGEIPKFCTECGVQEIRNMIE